MVDLPGRAAPERWRRLVRGRWATAHVIAFTLLCSALSFLAGRTSSHLKWSSASTSTSEVEHGRAFESGFNGIRWGTTKEEAKAALGEAYSDTGVTLQGVLRIDGEPGQVAYHFTEDKLIQVTVGFVRQSDKNKEAKFRARLIDILETEYGEDGKPSTWIWHRGDTVIVLAESERATRPRFMVRYSSLKHRDLVVPGVVPQEAAGL